MKRFLILFVIVLFPIAAQADPTPTPAPTSTGSGDTASSLGEMDIGKIDLNKEPTYINSNSLTLLSEKRIFVYTGNVIVTQADMTLTSDTLEGRYNEQNQIEQLTAKSHVVIIKGAKIRATSEKAVYLASDRTVTLTENPALDQQGSTLTADVIKIYLDENRSVAEGQVKVKLVKAQGTPVATPTPTGTPEGVSIRAGANT